MGDPTRAFGRENASFQNTRCVSVVHNAGRWASSSALLLYDTAYELDRCPCAHMQSAECVKSVPRSWGGRRRPIATAIKEACADAHSLWLHQHSASAALEWVRSYLKWKNHPAPSFCHWANGKGGQQVGIHMRIVDRRGELVAQISVLHGDLRVRMPCSQKQPASKRGFELREVAAA